jgi:hypothetical protein
VEPPGPGPGRPRESAVYLTPEGVHLRKLWDEHRSSPVPVADIDDPRSQEIVLFASWLGTIVDAALARGGRLAPQHRHLLDARSSEGDPSLWRAAAELGEPVRSYVARLLAMEEALVQLPSDG